jgi:hypothetical protein
MEQDAIHCELARCHGYRVAAGDSSVGLVETPMFAAAASAPDYLIVRTGESIAGTFRIVPASLVVDLDPARRLVILGIDKNAVAGLAEHLPLERR